MSESKIAIVRVQATLEDSLAFQRFCTRSIRSPAQGVIVFGVVAWALLILNLPDILVNQADIPRASAVMFSIGGGFLILVPLWRIAVRKFQVNGHDPEGLFLRPHEVTISPDGVALKSDVADLKYRWQAFQRVDETPTHFFFYTDRWMAYIIPKRGFPSNEDADRFAAILRENIKTATT